MEKEKAQIEFMQIEVSTFLHTLPQLICTAIFDGKNYPKFETMLSDSLKAVLEKMREQQADTEESEKQKALKWQKQKASFGLVASAVNNNFKQGKSNAKHKVVA